MAANVQSHYIGTDGDVGKTTNWSLTRGGASKGAIPAADEDVFIENLKHALATGTDQSSIDLHNLLITIADGGSVGTSANPLQYGISNTTTNAIGSNGTIPIAGPMIRNNGGAPVYFKAGDDGVDELTIVGAPEFVLTGAFVNLYAGQIGSMRLADGFSCSGVIDTTGMGIDLEAGTGSIAEIIAQAGNHRFDRSVTTAGLHGRAHAIARKTAAITTLNLWPNSHYIHNSSGTIGTIVVRNGAVASAAGATAPFTVTNAIVHAGGKLFEDAPAGLITYTNAPVHRGF